VQLHADPRAHTSSVHASRNVYARHTTATQRYSDAATEIATGGPDDVHVHVCTSFNVERCTSDAALLTTAQSLFIIWYATIYSDTPFYLYSVLVCMQYSLRMLFRRRSCLGACNCDSAANMSVVFIYGFIYLYIIIRRMAYNYIFDVA